MDNDELRELFEDWIADLELKYNSSDNSVELYNKGYLITWCQLPDNVLTS